MTAAPYHAKLAKALDRQGGLWTLQDILERLADGRMQSFVAGNSWLICQISVFPQRRVLEVIALVGDLEDYRALDAKLTKFANKMDVDLVSAYGRRGWKPFGTELGWKVKATNYLFQKDL
jgi:hypothetical protein